MEQKLILKKINQILKSSPNISKNRRNTQQNYYFRGIDDFYETFQPLFAEHEITVGNEILSSSREERQSKTGGTLVYSVMTIRWKFEAMDGSAVFNDAIGEALDSGDKASNKAMSASLKYALTQRFLVSTGEDQDTENASHEIEPKSAPQRPASPAQRTSPQRPQPPRPSAPVSPKQNGMTSAFAAFAGSSIPNVEHDVP
jgi:hypothetical protein